MQSSMAVELPFQLSREELLAVELPFQLLRQLPEELLDAILSQLDPTHLKALNLCSRWAYVKASPHLWREVSLIDHCHTGVATDETFIDEHDDTPLIKVLLILATNPWLASMVQIVNHRCHLPPPAIFEELPFTSFNAQTLSCDPRTIRLVRLAVHNLHNVHTLRIIFGHPRLTDALLRCFFDRNRQCIVRIRRLWLETCRVVDGLEIQMSRNKYALPLNLDFAGLESLRIRRLPLGPSSPLNHTHMYSRNNFVRSHLSDGAGGHRETSLALDRDEQDIPFKFFEAYGIPDIQGQPEPHTFFTPLFHESSTRDDAIYAALARSVDLPTEVNEAAIQSYSARAVWAYQTELPSSLRLQPKVEEINNRIQVVREKPSALDCTLGLFQSCSATLTSLNLDWVLFRANDDDDVGHASFNSAQSRDWFLRLFDLRFPNLIAFQLRSAIVPETGLPEGLYLLSPCPDSSARREHQDWRAIDFMEAHPKLQSLAWPMDRFFSPDHSSEEIARVEGIITNLSRSLTHLRVDVQTTALGEPHSALAIERPTGSRMSRHRFIAEFASRMLKVESFKIEGGVPMDERRESIRALHACPLHEIVMIGVSWPLGNTWGYRGEDMPYPQNTYEAQALESEDKTAIWALGHQAPVVPDLPFHFRPSYGWVGAAPMLHNVAAYHGASLRQFKVCGYQGAPVLLSPAPITSPMLKGLQYLHKLELLITSLWLPMEFEGMGCGKVIADYWNAMHDPRTTALSPMRSEVPKVGTWEYELHTKYKPEALARRTTAFIGPYLSEQAKSRPRGVCVRASFLAGYVGQYAGMFDLELAIGKDALKQDICLGFEGPRAEIEPKKRREKLENRQWF